MSYSPLNRPIVIVGRQAGPINRTPPFRRIGFRSFQGLGADMDRRSTDDASLWVTSLSAPGLPHQAAVTAAPGEIASWMQHLGFESVTSGWGSGGQIWLRYSAPATWSAYTRRSRVKEALAGAAARLGPAVRFGLPDGSSVPAGAGAPAPTPTIPSGVDTPDVPTGPAMQTIQVPELQRLLLQKGFSVGSTGADGVWGGNTESALRRALGDRTPRFTVSSDRRSISIPVSDLSHVRGLADNAVPSTTRVSPAVAPDPGPPPGGGIPDEVMITAAWVGGAAVLLGVGGYFLWKSSKDRKRAAVTANRRRRRRRSRR